MKLPCNDALPVVVESPIGKSSYPRITYLFRLQKCLHLKLYLLLFGQIQCLILRFWSALVQGNWILVAVQWRQCSGAPPR